MPEITGPHHIAYTVSNAERTAAWYSDLLGMQIVMSGDDDELSFRVLVHPQTGWMIGLRQYRTRPDGPFDEFRTGLDHFAFGVPDRAALKAWEDELRRRDVVFTPITDTPIGTVIVFRDPDNVQLEFWLPAQG